MEQETASTPQDAQGKVQGRYHALEEKRQPYLRRGWECSELTVPSLLPRTGTNSTTELPIPWQTIGARGTHNLSSKLLMSTLPTNTPFFRQSVQDHVIDKMAEETGVQPEVLKSQFEAALAKVERATMSFITSSTDRVAIEQAYKHLIVVGNVLLFRDPKKGMRVFTLNNYVVRRDRSGNVMEIVIKECVDPKTLPKEIQAQAQGAGGDAARERRGVTLSANHACEDEAWRARQQPHRHHLQRLTPFPTATAGRGRAKSVGGFWRTTGSMPSSCCLTSCSTIPVSSPTSGCCGMKSLSAIVGA